MERKPIVVTGAAGFIGSNFVRLWLSSGRSPVVSFDKLSYAGNLDNLREALSDERHTFVHGDICDRSAVRECMKTHSPAAIVHFAAESHVDRSISGPGEFIETNINGTFCLLEEARRYWQALPEADAAYFRFLHVSTDEVYGSLAADEDPFSEDTRYAPNSPYAASKASADHLVRAYHHTYGLPTLTTNCSNNYGPNQFPEKLIPLVIHNAIHGKPLPIYGDGRNVRDWLFVGDHCEALMEVLKHGNPGATYNIGGRSEKTNLEVVRMICSVLDELHPASPITPHEKLIAFVQDRPGHDQRYAIDCSRIERELGWQAEESFESGIRKTVQWYLQHEAWVDGVTSGAYREWVNTQYVNL